MREVNHDTVLKIDVGRHHTRPPGACDLVGRPRRDPGGNRAADGARGTHPGDDRPHGDFGGVGMAAVCRRGRPSGVATGVASTASLVAVPGGSGSPGTTRSRTSLARRARSDASGRPLLRRRRHHRLTGVVHTAPGSHPPRAGCRRPSVFGMAGRSSGAPADARSAAPVRRQHLLPRAVHAHLLGRDVPRRCRGHSVHRRRPGSARRRERNLPVGLSALWSGVLL